MWEEKLKVLNGWETCYVFLFNYVWRSIITLAHNIYVYIQQTNGYVMIMYIQQKQMKVFQIIIRFSSYGHCCKFSFMFAKQWKYTASNHVVNHYV